MAAHWTTRMTPPITDAEITRISYADWISGWRKNGEIHTRAPQLSPVDTMEGSEEMYIALNNAGIDRIGVVVTDLTKNDNWEADMFEYLDGMGDGYPRDLKTVQEVYDWVPTYSFINELFNIVYPDAKFAWPPGLSTEEWNNGLMAWLLERDGLLKLNRSYYPK